MEKVSEERLRAKVLGSFEDARLQLSGYIAKLGDARTAALCEAYLDLVQARQKFENAAASAREYSLVGEPRRG